MSSPRVFVLLLAAATALNIRTESPFDVKAVTCAVDMSVSLVLADDEVLDQKSDEAPTAAEKATYNKALQDYKVKKQAMQVSTGKLMAAMEDLLEVPPADAAFLTSAATGKMGKDALVVFYAPWCPHCQTFVLHDAKGNPTNAPLEVLRRDLANTEKNVVVARADVTKLRAAGKPVPPVYKVQGIPTVYFVNEKGAATQFAGNPHNIAALKNFIGNMKTGAKKAAPAQNPNHLLR
jgi:thiol-disulfide isomerase/thioredoxin